jgi:peptide/nickel transport system permease protein
MRRTAMRDPAALASGLVVCGCLAVALFVPFIALADPNRVDTVHRLLPPLSGGHPLGTDQFGRDMLSRIAWGSRLSLSVGVAAATASMLVGGVAGAVAGYAGGIWDHLISRSIDVLMAFPYILLAIAIVAALGSGVGNALVAIAIVGIPLYVRIVRGAVLVQREREYVHASRALGATDGWLIRRQILPGLVAPVVVVFSLDIGSKILATASLSFLGLGALPPTADWGSMLADGRNYLGSAAHVATLPGLAIAIITLAFNTLGDTLRDILDPTLKT